MKTSSNIEPAIIEPDMGTLTPDGQIEVLVHWGITEISRTDDQGNPYTAYEYEEERIRVPLPAGVRSEPDISVYLTGIQERLMLLAGSDEVIDRLRALEDLMAAVVEGAI